MNRTELMSFLDPGKTYTPAEVPGAFIDFNVVGNVLRATLASGAIMEFGRWTGPAPIQSQTIELDTIGRIKTTLNNGVVKFTEQCRFDEWTEANTVGLGLHVERQLNGNYNDSDADWYNESQKLMYALAPRPESTTIAYNHVVTAKGVDISSSAMWSASYKLYDTLNRSTGGWLGSSAAGGYILHTYPTAIPFRGFIYQNLRSDYRTTAFVVEVSANGTDWVEIQTKNISADIMGLHEHTIPQAMSVTHVRIRFLSYVNAPGCGRFDVIVDPWGYIEKFKPLVFDPTAFKVTETATELELDFKAPGNGGGGLYDGTLNLKNYVRFMSKTSGVTYRSALSDNVIPMTEKQFDGIGVPQSLPGMKLPAGRYWTKLLCRTTCTNASVLYLKAADGTEPFTHYIHYDNGAYGECTGFVTAEFEINLTEDTVLMLVDSVSKEMVIQRNQIEAIVEFWKL